MEESGLAYIEIDSNTQPLALFWNWLEESRTYVRSAPLFNLATADKNGRVSNRNVLLRELKDDAFVFTTNKTGRKCKHIMKNPQVAACFLWVYTKEGKHIKKQVRIEGTAEEIPRADLQRYYDVEPLFGKIRYHICDQSQPTEWTELKAKHDNLYSQVLKQNYKLPLPDKMVGYKIIPKILDFYFAYDMTIADRIVFTLNDSQIWSVQHVAP